MTATHICCESCVQDIQEGYGNDITDLGLCCCKDDREDER